ncbi:MAG: hypothetical protein CMJ39_06415 [Phycisphaerae bacterium]|nr:hypothetical protein [Phycisphaerae bacterium]
MKRFILGTLAGILIVAAIVTMVPERAHSLIDQAGDVRNMLNDVVARLEQMEERNSREVIQIDELDPRDDDQHAESETIEIVLEEQRESISDPVAEFNEPRETPAPETVVIPESVERQTVNFDNLAAGLARVSGALERLNRTMKPGTRSKPRSEPDASNIDGNAS